MGVEGNLSVKEGLLLNFFLLFKDVEMDSCPPSKKRPRWGDNTSMQTARPSITSSLDQPGPSHDSVNSAQNSMRESVIRYAPRSLCNELTATSMVSAIYQISFNFIAHSQFRFTNSLFKQVADNLTFTFDSE